MKTYAECLNYLNSRIESKINTGYMAGIGLDRVKYTLGKLGNPQEKLKVIHIAGTSGKGSTASYISRILQVHNFKTGLTVSPHIEDVRERIQIDNKPISKDKFKLYFNKLLSNLEKSEFETLSYFEILIILTYYIFNEEKVDYAVIETGLGGTYDATNCIKNPNKLCVIPRIGKDHTKILGNTLTEIASNKAGIINQNQYVIFLNSDKNSTAEILKKTNLTKSDFKIIEKNVNENAELLKDIAEKFDLAYYQLENLNLATYVTKYLAIRDNFNITNQKISNALKISDLKGRFQKFYLKDKLIILDGAHNPQKMKALVDSLTKKYQNKKFDFIIGIKTGKDFAGILKYVVSVAGSINLTTFKILDQDLHTDSVELDSLEKELLKQNYKGKINKNSDVNKLLVELLKTKNKNIIVVTGSLYLLSKVDIAKLS